MTFGIEKLEQTGKTYIVNGEKIKAHKKTNNKWFEIQDSISYWDKYAEPVPQSDAKGKVHFRNNTVPKPR